jgi:large subunit ribosomal protein L18
VSASTRDTDVIEAISAVKTEGIASKARSAKSVVAAKALGTVLAGKMKDKKIDTVVFDRNGFVYMGRLRAVADGMREAGIKV